MFSFPRVTARDGSKPLITAAVLLEDVDTLPQPQSFLLHHQDSRDADADLGSSGALFWFFFPLLKHLDMMGNQLEMQTKAVKLTQGSEPFTKADVSEGWGDGLSNIFRMTKFCCDCRCKSGFMSG